MTWFDRDKLNFITSQQKCFPTLVSREKKWIEGERVRKKVWSRQFEEWVMNLRRLFQALNSWRSSRKQYTHLLPPESCGNSSPTIRLATCNILAGFKRINYSVPQQYRQGKWTNPILMETIIQFYIIGPFPSPGQQPILIHL